MAKERSVYLQQDGVSSALVTKSTVNWALRGCASNHSRGVGFNVEPASALGLERLQFNNLHVCLIVDGRCDLRALPRLNKKTIGGGSTLQMPRTDVGV